VIDLNKVRENKTGRILGSPWVKLPNVRSFNVQLSLSDPIFALFGIEKKYKPTLFLDSYRANGINRYLEHQVRRLTKARNDPRVY